MRPPWHHRYLGAVAAKALADGIRTILLPILAASTGTSGLGVAAVTAALRAPWLILSIPVGAFADRIDKGRAFAIGMGMCAAACVATAVALGLRASILETLLACAVVVGCLDVLLDNLVQIMPRYLFPAESWTRVNAMVSVVLTVFGFLLAPLAAPQILNFGSGTGWLVSAGLYAVAAALGISFTTTLRQDRRQPTLALSHGISWLRKHPEVGVYAAVSFWQNLFSGGATAVLVLMAERVMHIGNFGYAALIAVTAIGQASMSAAGARLPGLVDMRLLPVANVAIGAGEMLLGIWHTPPIGVVAMMSKGMATGFWNIATISLRQGAIPPETLGSVNGSYRFIAWAGVPIGALGAGFLSTRIGVPGVFIVTGASVVLITPVLLWARHLGCTPDLTRDGGVAVG